MEGIEGGMFFFNSNDNIIGKLLESISFGLQ